MTNSDQQVPCNVLSGSQFTCGEVGGAGTWEKRGQQVREQRKREAKFIVTLSNIFQDK